MSEASEIDGYCNQATGGALLAGALAIVLLIVVGGVPPIAAAAGLGLTGVLFLTVGSLQLRDYYRNT